MKTKFTVIFLSAFLLGAFVLFGAVSAVHAEDVTPTPEATPTETSTPAPTEVTPMPTDTPTPEPTLTETPEPVLEAMAAFASPMLLAATPTKAVWFNSSIGVQSYDTFTEAFNAIDLNLIPSDGLIHVESIYAGGETDPVLSLYYDGSKPYSSTAIKGIVGENLNPDTLLPQITIYQPMEFMNFTGGFMISNICIDTTRSGPSYGALTLSNMSGTQTLKNLVVNNDDSTSSGIVVETLNGSIIVTNVDSSGNAGGGAYLRTGTSGSITVTNSSFDENGVVDSGGTIISGLVVETINSNSPVTLNGVSASGNTSPDAPGVLIKKSGSLTVKNSMFNNNLGGGLANKQDPVNPTIQGAALLDNVTASDNYQELPDLRGGSGIELFTNGAITANNIFATGNLNYGMKLDNCNLESSVCKSTVNGAVVVSNSEFSGNNLNSGLNINSRGSVTLTKVKANDNSHAQGIVIDNSIGTSGVTLNGAVFGDNQVNGNGEFIADIGKGGIEINTKGNILINYLQAGVEDWENHLSGAVLKNLDGTGTITVNNSSFQYNLGQGLILRSKKNITLKNVIAESNEGDFGVDLDNYAFGAGTGNVVINGSAMRGNGRLGLNVITQGTITIGTSDVSNNPDGGANLENHAPVAKSIAITKSTFNENAGGNGLTILNLGNIALTNVAASGNGLGGFEILDSVMNIGGVLINNSTNPLLYNFSDNGDFGLDITTKGAVTLTSVYADGTDFGGGAVIDNSQGLKLVVIASSHFNKNLGGDGLYVKSSGAISLTKTSASGNSGWGASLQNGQAISGILAITIVNDVLKLGTELNGFNDNDGGGVKIDARGVVTLTNVEASENTGNGGFITNFAGSPADVKITNSYFDFNGDLLGGEYGLYVESMGNITLNGGRANENFIYGAKLDNQRGNAFPIKNITITKFEFSNNETSFGLEAHANGTITSTSIKADGNGTYGAHLDNRLDDILLKDSGMGLVVKSSSFSLNHAGIGLDILTAGSVLMDGVTANSNIGGEGIKITSEPLLLSLKPVTVNRTSANGNSLDGLKVGAVGLITLNGVTATGNLLSGAVLDNSSATTTTKPAVTILATLGTNNFNGNRQGLTINSRGPVSLTSVTANFSTHNSGIYINNQYCSGDCPRSNVNLNKVTTRGNYGDGVYIFETNAASITMTGLISLSNGGSGVYIHSFFDLAKISILSGLFMGNSGYGIDIDRTGSNYPILTGTSYFGNDTGNLFIH